MGLYALFSIIFWRNMDRLNPDVEDEVADLAVLEVRVALEEAEAAAGDLAADPLVEAVRVESGENAGSFS